MQRRRLAWSTAMDEIQYVLGSDFDEDEWMDVTQCIVMDPLCFADMEKVFMERLAEKESSNVTGPAHLLDKATQQWKDCEGEVGTSGKKVKVAIGDDDRDGMASTPDITHMHKLSAWHTIPIIIPSGYLNLLARSSNFTLMVLPLVCRTCGKSMVNTRTPTSRIAQLLLCQPLHEHFFPGSLLKDLSAWRLMMDWAQDKIGYPDLDNKLRGFGSRYIHEEWRPLISAIFAQSDPSNEEPQPPSSLVEEAMRAYGVSFVTHADPVPTVPASQPNPPRSTVRRSSGKAPRNSKRRKTGISQFLDLAAEEDDSEDDYADEDIDETQGSAGCPTDAGPAGKSSFSRAIDGLMARYSGPSRPSRYAKAEIATDPGRHSLARDEEHIHCGPFFGQMAVDVVALPWLPRRLYVAGTCSMEVRNHLPPSHSSAAKDIILLPPTEATSLSVFKARQTLPVRTWVRIKKGPYKGDIGFVERSYPTNVVLIVAPRERPYDLPEQRGEKSLFSSELAITAGLDPVPILSSTGVDIGFTCCGYDFIRGLLRLTIPTDSVILVELPHPDDIAFHMIADFERSFMEETVLLFSAQFWREFDTVEIRSGELRGSRGRLIDVEWYKRTASLFLPTDERLEGDVNVRGETIHCAIQELRRVFNMGQALEVSDLLLEAHTPDHVRSLATGHADTHMHLPEPADAVLPGDTVNISQGAYKGAEAPIEWMSVDGTQAWIYVKETKYSSMQTGVHSTQGQDPDQQVQYSSAQTDVDDTLGMHPDRLVGYIMVPVNVHDVRVHRAARTLAFSKEKGFDICVGDDVEVARGKWFRSRGTGADGTLRQLHTLILCVTHMGKRAFGPAALTMDRPDVWVIRGEKKGYQGTLRTLGRDISCVALQGQLIQLRNDYIATPTGLVLNGTRLPLGAVQELQRRSFIPDVRSVTPPPSAPPPSAIPEDPSATTSEAWTTTADDLSSTDFGEIPWLFQANCCNFQHYQLGFTVNDQYRPYNNASLSKRIVRTRCPDPFRSDTGVAPPGHVCVTVTGHNRGSGIQHHVIPATCLKPANPTAKNQLCMVTKGPRSGEILSIKHCQKNARKVVAQDGAVMSFDEVCLAFSA
ncbi:hypothetical protein EDC04DRAFT_2610872 [Pisolithus marmoratus]|nr:hypothetical protein EDC04DRAFT_2610872 [Pisolithus marmoratus]